MAAITSINVAQAITKLVAVNAVPSLVGNLVMGNLINRDYESTLQNSGDVVNISVPPSMSANNIAEGGTVTTQNPSLGNAQIVLNSHIEASFLIPDITRILATPDLINVYMQPCIIALAEKIETDILNVYSTFTYNTAVGGTSTITEAVVDSAESALFSAKVPQDSQWNLVVAASPYGALRQIPRFTETQTVGAVMDGTSSPIKTGTVGNLKNFNVYRSQYVALVSTTYQNIAFHRNAIGMAVRRLPVPMAGTGAVAQFVEMGNFGMRVTMSYAPNSLAQQFTVDCLYGVGPLRQNHLVLVNST